MRIALGLVACVACGSSSGSPHPADSDGTDNLVLDAYRMIATAAGYAAHPYP